MGILAIIIGCLLFIFVDYLIAKEFNNAAQEKGYYAKKYFWICFLLGAVGYLLVIALPNRTGAHKEANDELPPL